MYRSIMQVENGPAENHKSDAYFTSLVVILQLHTVRAVTMPDMILTPARYSFKV